MVIFESKSGKYSFDADVELDRLLTADPLLDDAESRPSLELEELEANESLL